jgi:hypothetical protein
MPFRSSNESFLDGLQEYATPLLERLWQTYSDATLERLQHHSPLRIRRQLQHYLDATTHYHGTNNLSQKETNRRIAMQWLVFQGFEESLYQEGQERVTRRHFPSDNQEEWRHRAQQTGTLFLLAREYLREHFSQHPTPHEERTRQAIELAEQWQQGQCIPTDQELEPYVLLIWYRRCQDLTRELARSVSIQHKREETLEPHNQQEQLALSETDPLATSTVRPDVLYQQEESQMMLTTLFLSVCKDDKDKGIVTNKLNDITEHESANQLNLTRAQLRSRWQTLSNRAKLLFKVVSLAELSTAHANNLLLHAIQSQLDETNLAPKEKQMGSDFWLTFYRLGILFLERQKKREGSDQKTNWNAIVQLWRRTLEALIQHNACQPNSPLLPQLVTFWSRANRPDTQRGQTEPAMNWPADLSSSTQQEQSVE